MGEKDDREPIFRFILLTAAIWIGQLVILRLLQPYSAAYTETGTMTAGYILYAAVGILFSTPGPFWAMLILSVRVERIGLGEFFRRIFAVRRPLATVTVLLLFCGSALIFGLLYGIPNGAPWYMMPLGAVIMVPFVGIAEETGWRGFLQPALEKRVPYPFSVLITAAIWFAWHLNLWFDPTSRHYGDSLLGFGITILLWAFALAAIYNVTKSVLACAVYHSFIDALGAVYDWNLLFDAFPGNAAANAYRCVILCLSVALWLYADGKERRQSS